MRIPRAIRSMLARRGVKVERLPRSRRWPQDPYSPNSTCQIRHLAEFYRLFFGPPSPDRSLMEIGAFDGYTYSNTWQLIQLGWRADLFEPVPHHAARCRNTYAGMPNVKVHEIAIGPGHTKIVLRLGNEYTTADAATADAYQSLAYTSSIMSGDTIEVETVPLSDFSESLRRLDLLVVDVEGYESEVFKTFDLRVLRPKMIIVELTECHPHYGFSRAETSETFQRLTDASYVPVYRDLTNTILVSREHYEAVVRGFSNSGERSSADDNH